MTRSVVLFSLCRFCVEGKCVCEQELSMSNRKKKKRHQDSDTKKTAKLIKYVGLFFCKIVCVAKLVPEPKNCKNNLYEAQEYSEYLGNRSNISLYEGLTFVNAMHDASV